MTTELTQTPHDAGQMDESAGTSATRRRTPSRPREGSWIAPKNAETAMPLVQRGSPLESVEVEEFFQGIVEEVGDDAIRLRTVSSAGEEGAAWLPIAKIPDDERKYIALGAPVRVSVLVSIKGTRQRRHEIRFLRPSQWHRPSDAARNHAAEYLVREMQALLSRSRKK